MKDVVVGFFVGLAIAFLGVYLTGFSAAITVPETVIEALNSSSFLVWEIAVIQFLGYGVVAFLLLFVAVRSLKLNPWLSALAAFITCEAVLFTAYSSDYFIYIPHILVLAICSLLGAFVARRQANA